MSHIRHSITRRLDHFLFESASPHTCVVLRIAFATLLLVYLGVWSADAAYWFSDEGVLTTATAGQLVPAPFWSLFNWVPATPAVVTIALAILILQSVCLLAGLASRFQAACLFVGLVSFQNRNPVIGDAEDTMLRIAIFCLIFMPLDYRWSLGRWMAGRPAYDASLARSRAWGLRLLQFHLSLLYLSAAACKWFGSTWRDGSALYYVYQMEDLFGRGPLPMWLMQEELAIRLSTWAVLAVESLLPVALWFRPTRTLAVAAGIALHLSLEYAMHLHLFQWIMMASLLAFLPKPMPLVHLLHCKHSL